MFSNNNKDKIQEIISQNNIIDVVKNFLTLEKKGNNYFGLCPFHDDTKPSLVLNETKQIYKCFACNEAGNVCNFLMKFKHMSFIQAITYLGNRINYDLNWLNIKKHSQTEQEKNFLITLNQKVQNYYYNNLFVAENKASLNYLLKTRKLPLDIIKKYQIGFAGKNDNIIAFLEEDNYQLNDLVKYSIAKLGNENIVAYFNNRIIISWKNLEGQTVGFSGRLLTKNSNKNVVRYLNTKSNLLFSKNEILFNLNYAWKEIKKIKYVFLVEGYFDCFSLIKVKILNVVALLGLNISKQQIQLLKDVTKKIILYFDSDKMGILATNKIAQILIKNKFQVKILTNKSKLHDPDTFVNQNLNRIKHIYQTLRYCLDYESFKLQNYDLLKTLTDSDVLKSQPKKVNLRMNRNLNSNLKKTQVLPFDYLFLNLIMQLILSVQTYHFLIKAKKMLSIYLQLKNDFQKKLFQKILNYYKEDKSLMAIDLKKLWNFFYDLNDNETLRMLNWIKLQLKIKKNYDLEQIKKIISKYETRSNEAKKQKIIKNLDNDLNFKQKINMLKKLK